MKLRLEEYRTRKLLNVHQHVDGPWFWTKYSAYPCVGCRSGCEFCYARGGHYAGRRDPADFDSVIRVKVNAIERLRKELPRRPPELLCCGDWQQPAEGRYRLSRGMLEVVLELGFPLLVIERSPLLTRDLDLLMDINAESWVGVIFSIGTFDPQLKRLFLETYALELEQESTERIWAYRRAAWTVDEWPESIGSLWQEMGTEGLRSLPGIGHSLAALIARWLQTESQRASPEAPRPAPG